MYLEIHVDRRRKTPYTYGLFRETFRQDGKVRHRTRGRVTGLSPEQLRALQGFLQEGCPSAPLAGCRVTQSREYGAVRAVLEVARVLGLPRLLYSRQEDWVRHALAMIVGRVVYQGSKLGLTNLWKDTALWSLCGLGEDRPDVDACYAAMDQLLARQPAIQKALAGRHLQDGCLVLYDVTSSYFEGRYAASQLVTFGYNRDGKRGHKQVVIGLLTNAEGCPVGACVYRGNTNDQKTLPDRVKELKEQYHLRDVVLAGDRGMLTAARLPELSEAGIRSVTALTHPQILRLVERKVIEPGLFDEREIAEIYDPASPQVRYLLCRNPLTAEREHRTRETLIGKTREGLEQLARSRKKRTAEAWGAAVGVLLARYKVGKFFAWSIPQNKLEWQLDSQRVAVEESLDGCYVVRTDVSASMLDKNQAVASYRRLAEVDRGFRQIKTVSLEIRPTYHQLDRRIEGHVFVCMLAYYLQWQMQQRLAPLFALDGKGKNRRWTFGHVLERLKAIRQETVQMDQTEVSLKTTPDAEQQQILDLLGVSP
ncbi:IS1634 family transposase [Candidatus Bathyarchaeota archaeon]|nr:IS1634 family transposase [Candidatus Bathyarchaeota archaeon]